MRATDREPCFWTSTRPGYNRQDREKRRIVDGKTVVERVPQVGHIGTSDYDNPIPARNSRWAPVLRHDGNVVSLVFTSAAAALDPNTSFGQYQRAKMRHFGWFHIGACPLSLLTTGQMRRDHFRDQSLLADRPCEPGTCNGDNPCRHAMAEWDARRKQRKADDKAHAATHRDPQQEMIDAQREQTAQLVEAISGAKRKTEK